MIKEIDVDSFSAYIQVIRDATSNWYRPTGINPWFRGQSDARKVPLPSVFRKGHKESDLTNSFRLRAGMFTDKPLPQSPAQWLSLMQHVGLPTRLLDWTDSALAGLYFAVNSSDTSDAAVWLLDPIELNKLSNIENLPASDHDFVMESYRLAFGLKYTKAPSKFPIAILPTYVHKRMAVQRGCFTIHGSDKRSFVEQFKNHSFSDNGRLIKLRVPADKRKAFKNYLDLMGIKGATLFPDLDGLARELSETF